MRRFALILILLTSALCGQTSDNKTFIPTKDWQEIQQGQSIPPGIHVRINMTSGKKEGKLLAEEKGSKKSALAISEIQKDNKSDDDSNHKQLKEALKNIPHDSFTYNESELKKINKKYKTYETIKQEFEQLRMSVKTDFELLDEILAKFSAKETPSDAEINAFFDDLDYLVHQIDNANRFVQSGGLDKIILPNIQNQTNSLLKLNSIKLLGTLIQNNPKAQIAAFEKNIGFILLQNLAQSHHTQEMSTLIFAFGALVRKFPLAQKELLNKPGTKILVDILGKNAEYKVKVKILKLISDLVREYDDVTQFESEFDKEKLRQYKEVNIKEYVEESYYCSAVDELLNENRQRYLENLYATDDILSTITVMKDICHPNWSNSPIFRHNILVIMNKYDRDLQKSPKDEDLSTVVRNLQELNDYLFKEETQESTNIV